MQNVDTVRKYLEDLLPSGLLWLEKMVRINSFTQNKEGVNRLARLTAEAFAPLGFGAQYVPSQSEEFGDHLVLSRAGSSSQNVAMIAHLDTVFPPDEEIRNNFHWQPEGDRIYGPGTEDIKGGTIMMWLVLNALQAHAPHVFERITWRLLWNSSEERFSPDFGQVCRDQFDEHTKAALVFEAEGRQDSTGLLVVARKGRGTWRATATGCGSHAGGKHQRGANAIVQLAHTIQQIHSLTDYGKELTFNVGSVTGGTVLNRVPHEAVAEGEFRAFSPEVYSEAKRALLALSGPGQVCNTLGDFRCSVILEVLSESRPWPRNAATDRLYDLWKTAADEVSVPVSFQERGGLSDGNLIWDAVPTLDGLGPWGDNDHCSERSADGSKLPEYVEVSSFVPKALVNTLAIIKLAGGMS